MLPSSALSCNTILASVVAHPLLDLVLNLSQVDDIPLSRPKRNISRDFSDAGVGVDLAPVRAPVMTLFTVHIKCGVQRHLTSCALHAYSDIKHRFACCSSVGGSARPKSNVLKLGNCQ